MIRRIRNRFIRIAVLVLALAMVLVALGINAANWVSVRAEMAETLAALAQSSEPSGTPDGPGRGPGSRGKRSRGLQRRLDESRFFSAAMSADGTLTLKDTSRAVGLEADALADVARKALASGRAQGLADGFAYAVTEQEGGGKTAVFLNCETRLSALKQLALFSAAACAGGILLAWLLVALFSRRAIQPLIDNAVRQKQFITDAGHELKTPLTVISANMDVLALEVGDNEWIRSTRKQTAGMRELVNELIYLSRLDEDGASPGMAPVHLSALVREVAEPFEAMADFAGKAMTVRCDDAWVQGDAGLLRRLISVLCDNAVKYAPEGDAIAVTLAVDARRAVLTTENGLAQPLPPEALAHLFDRFYRADASRSRESGGFGIGLSVAQTVAEKHGGHIRASQTGDRLRFTVTLPRSKAAEG